MYYTLGFKKNIDNCIKLISTKESGKFTSLIDLKSALGRYIDEVQPQSKIPNQIDELPVLITDSEHKAVLAQGFSIRSKLNDLSQASMIESLVFFDEEKYKEKIYTAISALESQNIELATLIKIIFRYLLFGKSSKAHGGSTSNALGILWVNPSDKWTIQDYCEFLVHEVTHQLLFLDERVYGHYSQYPQISKKENFAFSTILKRSRPLDKVIHSYFVGKNVLQYRLENWDHGENKFHLHPETQALKKGIRDTHNSLTPIHWQLMTNRVKVLYA